MPPMVQVDPKGLARHCLLIRCSGPTTIQTAQDGSAMRHSRREGNGLQARDGSTGARRPHHFAMSLVGNRNGIAGSVQFHYRRRTERPTASIVAASLACLAGEATLDARSQGYRHGRNSMQRSDHQTVRTHTCAVVRAARWAALERLSLAGPINDIKIEADEVKSNCAGTWQRS